MTWQRNPGTGRWLKLPSGRWMLDCCCDADPAVGCGACDPGLAYRYTLTLSGLLLDFEDLNGAHQLTNTGDGCAVAAAVSGGCCWTKNIPATECGGWVGEWTIKLVGTLSSGKYRWTVILNWGPGASCTIRFRTALMDTLAEFCEGPTGNIPFDSCSDAGCPHRRVDVYPPPPSECRCNDSEAGGLPKCNCAQIDGGATAVIS